MRGELRAALGVGLDERGEVDESWVQRLHLAVDTEMIAAEGAGADDGDLYGLRHGYFLAAGVTASMGASTASRQRA